MLTRHAQAAHQRLGKAFGAVLVRAVVAVYISQPAIILPHRLAISAPVTGKRPARQWLARVPFTLLIMDQRMGRKMRPQPA